MADEGHSVMDLHCQLLNDDTFSQHEYDLFASDSCPESETSKQNE